jgi:L-lactate dehydrogenase complex protein LldG
MSEQDNILARIREALTVPAPAPGSHGAESGMSKGVPTPADFARVLPAVGSSFEERSALFQKNALELKADYQVLRSPSELPARLTALATAEGWKKVAMHRGGLIDEACAALGLVLVDVDAIPDTRAIESCDAGISECDALVAQTGSVLVTSRSAGGRALSVLPPHHVVLARRDQMVGGLPDAFALVKARYGAAYPSMISFITGPSRTGDIERILVLGAHGPKKLTILCV